MTPYPYNRNQHAKLLRMAADLRQSGDLWAAWCMTWQARVIRYGSK
jgi:hypothetical protein